MMREQRFDGWRVAFLVASSLFSTVLSAGEEPGLMSRASWYDGERQWRLSVPSNPSVSFTGTASFDDAGLGTEAPLYPGDSAGGFLAAILVHGAIFKSVHDDQKNEIQKRADQVLIPYLPLLENYSNQVLLDLAVASMEQKGNAASTEEAPEIHLVIDPVFQMTQDQQAILLFANVAAFHPDANTVTYKNMVKVVSDPMNFYDPVSEWSANGGAYLKAISSTLLAEVVEAVVEMGINKESPDPAIKFQTVRYLVGRTENIERAKVLDERDGRLLLENLRGELFIVPTHSRDIGTVSSP